MVDFQKYAKFSKPGPRYTSYPTAVEFSEKFQYESYINYLNTLPSNRDLSLYLHIPFCRSACYFCGCNVVYTSKQTKMDRYLEYLQKEITLLSKQIPQDKIVTQFHFGGGTPTFFSASMLDTIMNYLKQHFHFDKEAEISCEIDPRFFNEEQMQVFAKHGFNRISFGVQDFDPKVQEAVHRVQSYEVTKQSVDLARKYGVSSINIDLIYGLPYQTFEGFAHTLELTKTLDPDRLAVFNYAHVPWMKKTMRKIDETTLPTPQTKLQILKHTIEFFQNSDYKMIGMDHFAKEDDELFLSLAKGELHRNFQGYTTKGGTDLVGIGLTSIGEGPTYYAQNYKEMAEYEEAIDAGKLPFWRGVELNEDDMIRKSVIMELMANFAIDKKRVEKEFGIDFNEYFKDAIAQLDTFIDEGLVSIDATHIKVSQTGTMVVRNIAMPFDAYMKKHASSKKTFSKTV
ncbi:MAG: oxygen-independent coproporphyrinogen III oxidase [Campylobacterota bacterium]